LFFKQNNVIVSNDDLEKNQMTIQADENEGKFQHTNLRLIHPTLDSPLMDLIIDLDYLRKKSIKTYSSETFMQIKSVFHFLESWGSARIEGNNTTVEELVESKLERKTTREERFQEIGNMETALQFIDSNVGTRAIDRAFIAELHAIVVNGLTKEGSAAPGNYRSTNVTIRNSIHIPPPHGMVDRYMVELIEFINRADARKYDLLKTAIAHHRFVWIHPYDNGNGRTVRLITYAMLVKQGFNLTEAERIINPTAVFCSNRKEYYEFLAKADVGDDAGLIDWTTYMLAGLRREIEKLDLLLDYSYLKEKILLPAIAYSLERKLITDTEAKILEVAVAKQQIMNSDIKVVLPSKDISDISRLIGDLKEKGMLKAVENKQRIYSIGFDGNFLLRGIINSLSNNSFLPKN
jgi:Fic family protein